jgi:hypothetical protein
MSTFDIASDAPGLLRAEAINITLKFDRTGPTTGRVSWNIPTPAAGCTAANQAYCGMLVALDTKPAAVGKAPTNGQVYNSDPTADANLFAGDKLDTAMVIGAFYQDRTTTFFDVSGLKANTPYYVTGYPVDCQLRYFIEGVHAYSTDYTNKGTDGTNGTHVVVLNPNQPTMGVQPTDATGLSNTPGDNYNFTIQLGIVPVPNRPLDSVECKLAAPKYTITVNGTDAQTFEELVAAINEQLALLSGGAQGATPPNTGAYYWNAAQKKLFQWNGFQHVELPVIYDTQTPSVVSVGNYWLNPTTNVLSFWNGSAWIPVVVIAHATDPTLPTADASFWFDGTNAYVWNGVTWCQVTIYNQATDPSLATVPPGGSYWYDTVNSVLYKWNAVLQMWATTIAIQYHVDPNALPDGTYWFNETANKLFTFNVPMAGWNEETNIAISENAPLTPAPGKFWFNPTTLELFQRNLANTAWTELDVIVFPFDPIQRSFCDLWWNTATDVLNVWDAINSVWVPVTSFFQQPVDPSLPPTIVEGAVWYNSVTGVLYVWENNCFTVVSFVSWPTDPTLGFTIGTVWHNTTNDTWFVWTLTGWQAIDIITSLNDPTMLPAGTFWFNPTGNALQMWNGASWVTILYSVTPLNPAKGALWYNTTTNVLMTWNGITWVPATPKATVELDCNGNLLFTDTTTGSLSYIEVTDGTLFAALTPVTFSLHDPHPGSDGASSQPTYTEVGIGTDGNDSFRTSLGNEIRYELGYPVVDVEVTKEQMDYAITKALSEFRARSSLAYKRGFFFMVLKANEQKYFLTNKVQGMHKIVDILGIYRLTSSFLSSAHGAGVYGQIVLQHLYNMGTFDLLSYHIMGEYTKLMEMLFAARITFTWNEQSRELFIHHKFAYREPRVAIEATVERTEQDLLSDRYVRPWIRRYAAATVRLMLAESRGKFSTLPGASGSVTLNADALRQAAATEIELCLAEIDDYVMDRPEEYGLGSTLTFG